jgi:hypothetical protein
MKDHDMSTQGSSSEDEYYAGCKLFVSPGGLSGFALGVDGNRTGWLYDFFVSRREKEGAAGQMMSLAVRTGADKLAIYDHPLLVEFFEQFGAFALSGGRRIAEIAGVNAT